MESADDWGKGRHRHRQQRWVKNRTVTVASQRLEPEGLWRSSGKETRDVERFAQVGTSKERASLDPTLASGYPGQYFHPINLIS